MVTMPISEGFYVTSGFGQRGGQYAGMHWGTDYGRDGGSGGHPIFAAKNGTVVRVGPASGFGQWIGVDHPASNGGGETIYGHIIPEVRLGQAVAEGQRIGRINPDSNTNGGVAPHLHLEWHRYTWAPPGPDRLNPETMLKGAKWPGTTSTPTPTPGGNLSNYFDVDWSQKFNFGGPRSTSGIQRVVVHTTENTAGTPAENVANYQITSQSGSYHVLVDTTGKRLRENTDDWITWSVGNNAGNVQGLNISFVAQAAWSRAAWLAQEKMLRQGATVVAHWCKTYNIPVKKVGTERGICGHGDLRVFGGTDHTDPGGNFPWDVFTRYVNEAISGTSKPKEWDEMASKQELEAVVYECMRVYLGPLISDVKDLRYQLTGSRDSIPGDVKKSYPGFPQLGQNAEGANLTVTDAIAATRRDLAEIRKAVEK